MKVYTLIDNVSRSDEYRSEFGLSYLIRTEKHTVLFDSGASGLFAENAEKMGVHLEDVDIAVLSHGHFDHGGGLEHFLRLNRKAKIYMSEKAFREYFNSSGKYIGLRADLMRSDRIVYIEDQADEDGNLRIDEEMMLVCPRIRNGESRKPEESDSEDCPDRHSDRTSRYSYRHPVNTYGLTVFSDGGLTADLFEHEVYLHLTETRIAKPQLEKPLPVDVQSSVIRNRDFRDEDVHPAEIQASPNCRQKTVLFSGCSHRGILNIVDWFRPDVLFGGFHLFPLNTYGEDAKTLRGIAEELLRYDTMYYTCHCTGIPQFEFLSGIMEDRIRYLAAGEMVEV